MHYSRLHTRQSCVPRDCSLNTASQSFYTVGRLCQKIKHVCKTEQHLFRGQHLLCGFTFIGPFRPGSRNDPSLGTCMGSCIGIGVCYSRPFDRSLQWCMRPVLRSFMALLYVHTGTMNFILSLTITQFPASSTKLHDRLRTSHVPLYIWGTQQQTKKKTYNIFLSVQTANTHNTSTGRNTNTNTQAHKTTSHNITTFQKPS